MHLYGQAKTSTANTHWNSCKARRKSELLQHQAFVHLKGNVPMCQICDTKFTRPSTLKSHMRIHTNETPFSCSLCHKKFKRKFDLTCHGKKPCGLTDHKKKPKENEYKVGHSYQCPGCKKCFPKPRGVKDHLRVHSNAKAFSCNGCGESFKCRKTLHKHNCVNEYKREKCETNEMKLKEVVNMSLFGWLPWTWKVEIFSLPVNDNVWWFIRVERKFRKSKWDQVSYKKCEEDCPVLPSRIEPGESRRLIIHPCNNY